MAKKLSKERLAQVNKGVSDMLAKGMSREDIEKYSKQFFEMFAEEDIEPENAKTTTQPTNLTQNITQTIDKGFGVDNVKPKVEEPTKTEIVSTLNKMGGLQPINTQAKAKVQEQPTPSVAEISEEEKAQKESNFWTDYDTRSFNGLFGGKQVLNGTETPEQRLSIIKNKQNEINSNLESDRNINYNVSVPSENSRINNAEAVKINFKKELRDFYDKAEGTIYADTEYVKPNARVQSADRNTLGKNISAISDLSFPAQIGIKKLFNINQDEGATNQNLSEDFLRGLDARQTSDDIAVNRIRKQLNEGMPIASSDIELYTNIGQGIKAERLQQKLIKGEIDEATFDAQIGKIQADRKELYDRNPDLVQARLAKIIADEFPKGELFKRDGVNTWMYTDNELDAKKEQFWNRAKKENPSITRDVFEKAFKNIKSDESILPFYNGIPKGGLTRGVVFGAADVFSNVIEGAKDIAPTAIGGKSYAQIYNESRNAEISDLGNKRTEADKNSKYYDVAYGFGQFLGQAGLAYAGGEVIGGASKLLGLGSKMTPTLEGSLGMETLMAEAETSAIVTEGTKDAVGFFKSIGYDVTKQQLASTMTTAYIQSYDQNLKQAMSWTDDNGKAIKVANVLSAVEGGTELILPDIALANKFLSSLKGQGFGKYLLGLSKEEIANGAFKKGVKTFVRGVIEGGKIGVGENIEEQLSNLISYNIQNSIAPQTIDKSFAESAKETFIGTTLSMAIPMAIGFGGAFNKQPKYTKESIYNAAQNTSNALDILNNEFHEGRISEKELNESKAVVASARKANEEIRDIVTPDGERINTDNKIEYVNSRAKQFVLEAKLKNAKDDNNAAIANMLQKQIDNEVKVQESILTSPQAKPVVEATPQTEEEKLQSLNTDGMQPSIQDNGQIVTTQPSGATTTTPTQTINGTGTYEFEGKLYIQGKDGIVTYENGNLPPTAEQEKVKKEGIFTPITPISNEQAQSPNIQVPSTEGTAVNGQGEITAQPQEVSIPTGNTPQIETKPLIEVPNNKTNLAELVTNNKDIFGDFAPMPRADGTYKPLELKKAIDIVEKYNEETQISNNAITQQNTKQNGKSNQEAINAKAEGQGQNDVVGNQVGVASTNKGTSTTATRTIEQIDLELETLDNSIGDNTTKDDLKSIFQQQKQLKAEKQQIVDTRNAEISKPFDEKITAFENEVKGLKKDIEDEGYKGKVLDNANAKITRLNDQIKSTKEEKVKALAQPISPSRENGNAQQATTAKSKEKLPISSKVGEAVTVNIGGKAISGIVESDEGGKLTLSSGNKIIELSNDQQYVDYASPVRLADNQDGIEVNGEVYTEVRFDISNGKEVAVLIKEDGSITINSNPQIIEELKYQSALAMLDEMSEQEAQKLKQKYESKRTTEKPTEERTNKTNGTTQQKSEEEIKLQEAIDEIGLIEQIALDDLENNDKKARLIEHENGKTYLVEKNKDGSYTATLNGRKVRQGNHLNSLIEMYKTQSKKESDELIPKLQKQLDDLKQEVLDKLYNKKNTKENATKESNKQQESGTESNISQREGTVQGQQEEGKGKGEQRSTENKGTDNSNSNKPSEAQKEVGGKTENEFDKVPVYSATREEGKAKEQQIFDILDKLPVGTKIKTEDGFKVVIENSTSKNGARTILIQDFSIQEDGSLLQGGIQVISKSKEGKSNVDYNPHSVFTNTKGERVTETEILTNEIVDLSTYDIYKYDNEQGKEVKIQDKAKSESQKEVKAESNPALRDVNIVDSKSDDIITELNKLKTPQEKLNWLKEKGLITPIVINGKSYNSIDYNDRIMVLAKIGKYNIPFYISTGQAGKKNVKAGNWYAIFGIGESGWINKGSEELINKQYDFPVFQKIAKILNEGVGNFESRENNGNGKIIEGIGYLEDSKTSISDFNAQMNLPITPAKNNTDSKTFYGNVNNVLNLVNDELKNVTQAKSESLLSKEQAPKEVVDEINSLNLTRVEGTNMGSKQADGTYVSTEKGGNRYEGRGKTTANSVEVNVTNPKVQTVEENTALRESVLQTQLDNNEISIEDLSGEALVNAYDYFKSKGIDNPTNKQVSEYIKTEGKGKVAIDDITDTKTAEVAKEITQQLKKEGYDSLYFREGNNQEGELIVFDNAKVKITKKENGKQNKQSVQEQQTPTRKTTKSNGNSSKSNQKKKGATGRTKKRDRQIKDARYLQALALTPSSARQEVLQYFIRGGKIHNDLIKSLYGKYDRLNNSKKSGWIGERNARYGLVDNNSGAKTINGLAHQLYEAQPYEIIEDTQIYRNAIEEVLNDFVGTRGMVDEMLKQIDAEQKDYEDRQEQEGREILYDAINDITNSDDGNEVVDYFSEMTDSEIEEILNNEKDFESSEAFNEYIANLEYSSYLASNMGSPFDEKPEKIQRIDDAKEKVSELAGKVNEAENTFYRLKEKFDKEEAKKQNDLFNKGAVANLIDDTAERKAIVDEAKTKLDTLRNELSDARQELKKAQDDLTSNQTEIPFATNESAVGTPKTTPQQKKEVNKIIEFFNKQFGLDVFAPFSEFASKLKSLGFSNLQAMVDAWHGSPYSFDKFTTDKIGTGEGAQAFGWGLYFTDLKDIAINYAKNLATQNINLVSREILDAIQKYNIRTNLTDLGNWGSASDMLMANEYDLDLTIKQLEEANERAKDILDSKTMAMFYEQVGVLKTLKEKGFKPLSKTKNLYKVSLHQGKSSSEYTWLEWDKPNNKILDNLTNKIGENFIKSIDFITKKYGGKVKNGALIYKGLSRMLGSDKQASLFLLENGIDGIKYPAESIARGATSDNARGFNYVVFDENAVTIEEKIQFLKKPNGEVLGFVDRDGKVYLNPDALTAETTFHELNHVQQSLIKIAAEQGDEKAKAVLRRWDKVVADYKVMEQFAKGGKIKIDKATIDLSSDVYKQGENETQAQHEERIRNEVWSYLTAPENAKKWELANKGSKISNFINSVVSYFKDKLGLKGLTNTQILNATLKDLIEHTSNSLMKGEWLDIKNNPIESVKFNKEYESSNNFDRWKGDNVLVSGSEVQDVKTGEPIVVKVHHGTTNEFYVFDSSVKGNIEGHLGKVNYFTTSEDDANENYLADGADITGRLENYKERIVSTLESEIDSELEDSEREDRIREVVSEFYPNFDNSSLDNDMSFEDIANRISQNELLGNEEKVLDLYVKLNNPIVLGNGSTWFDALEIDETYLEDATKEIADEYGISEEEAKSEYEYDIRDRAIEMQGEGNKLVDALEKALSDNGYDPSLASQILGENYYETVVDLDSIEKSLRKAELYDNENGEMAGSQVIADLFYNLGFDGIILTDVSERFKNMGLSKSTSHIHVFDKYNNQIKLADGTNKTFNPDTNDIRFSIYQGEQDTPLTPQDEQDLEEVVDDIKSGNSTIEQYSKLLDQKSLDYIKSKLEPAEEAKGIETPLEKASRESKTLYSLISLADKTNKTESEFIEENKGKADSETIRVAYVVSKRNTIQDKKIVESAIAYKEAIDKALSNETKKETKKAKEIAKKIQENKESFENVKNFIDGKLSNGISADLIMADVRIFQNGNEELIKLAEEYLKENATNENANKRIKETEAFVRDLLALDSTTIVNRTYLKLSEGDLKKFFEELTKQGKGIFPKMSVSKINELAESIVNSTTDMEALLLRVKSDFQNQEIQPILLAKVIRKLDEQGEFELAANAMADLFDLSNQAGRRLALFQDVNKILGNRVSTEYKVAMAKKMSEKFNEVKNQAIQEAENRLTDAHKKEIERLNNEINDIVSNKIENKVSVLGKKALSLIEKLCKLRKK
jgi:hypothetical protein